MNKLRKAIRQIIAETFEGNTLPSEYEKYANETVMNYLNKYQAEYDLPYVIDSVFFMDARIEDQGKEGNWFVFDADAEMAFSPKEGETIESVMEKMDENLGSYFDYDNVELHVQYHKEPVESGPNIYEIPVHVKGYVEF